MSRKPAEFRDHPDSFLQAKAKGAYRAVCGHVVDGDTYDFFVDLGLFQYAYVTVRLANVDTPEIYGVHAEPAGQDARAFVSELLLHKPCLLYTGRDPTTFGRFVADVEVRHDGLWQDLASLIKAAGYASA